MRYSEILAASMVAPLVAAHGIQGMPKIIGMPNHLRARNPWTGHAAPAQKVYARQGGDANGMCGTQGGNAVCAAGYCCSPSGYCGKGPDYCAGPDCQFQFGPGCDANTVPRGTTTKNDARPQIGSVPYGGAGIYSCVNPNQVALTYDDGPYIYTQGLLDRLATYGAKATFFMSGNSINKGQIDDNWSGVITNAYNAGHQIASHTWTHQNLDSISQADRINQMVYNEMAIRNILGKYPTYMRPPYSACVTQACMDDMVTLGYVVTYFDNDTDDYDLQTTTLIETAKSNFKNNLDKGYELAIAHDIHELSAVDLTEYMLQYLTQQGFTAVTVGECLGDAQANWYRDSTPAGPKPSSTSSALPTPTGPTSTDGSCGGTAGQSCIGFRGPLGLSQCCSQYGYCGNDDAFCGDGCNPLYGKCGPQPSETPSATSSAPIPTGSLATSLDGTCGYTSMQTCKGFNLAGDMAECCSEYGYCGNTADYCGTGCNPLYGKCGSSSSSSSSASATSSSSARPASSSTVSRTSSSSSTRVSSSSAVVTSSSTRVSSSSATRSASSSAVSSSSVRSASASSSASVSVSRSSTVSASGSASSSASVSRSASASSSSVVSSVSRSASSAASGSASASRSATPSASVSVAPSSVKSATPSASPSASKVSTPVASSTGDGFPGPAPSSTGGYVAPKPSYGGASVVKPSSTPCTSPTPTPTPSKPVSKDGKCGSENGGQTCAGYKDPFGNKVECCCKESGKCSTDPWACGVGCNKGYGNCSY